VRPMTTPLPPAPLPAPAATATTPAATTPAATTPATTAPPAAAATLAPGVPRDTSTLPASVTHAATDGAVLFSPLVPAGLGIALLAVVGLWATRVVRRRRRGAPPPPHRVLRSTAATLACLLLATLTVAAAVNVYAGYLPTVASAWRFAIRDTTAHVTDDGTTAQALRRSGTAPRAVAAHDTHWQVHEAQVGGSALGFGSRPVVVATPPGYQSSNAPYPVVYLFGGYPGEVNDWFQTGQVTKTVDALVAQGLMPFPVLVEPDINGNTFTDSEGLDAVGGPQVETWFTRDVVRYVDSTFRTVPDRGHRVLAGMSSGGFIALNYALRHQDDFGIALGLEPYGDPGNVTGRLLGGDSRLLHQNSPQFYAPTVALHRQLSLYLDVGAATKDVARVESLARIFHERRLDVVIRPEPGEGHTWSEATAGMPYALAFAASRLGSAALAETFPESDFPRTHRDRFSLLPEDDAQLQRENRIRCRYGGLGCPVPQPAGSVVRGPFLSPTRSSGQPVTDVGSATVAGRRLAGREAPPRHRRPLAQSADGGTRVP